MSTIVEPSPVLPATEVTDVVRTPVVLASTVRDTVRPTAATDRLPLIDLMRVLAAHLIVWHHLAFYGPVSTTAYEWLPGPIWALSEWGRCAVQVFFVLGGFTMARGLSQRGRITLPAAGQIVAKRYRRIGGPYLVMLAIAVLANALAEYWMDHESISAAPTLSQLAAHAVFLQDILGYQPLTAGIWYLAVDVQLGLLLLGLTMLSQRAVGDSIVGSSTWAVLTLLLAPLAAVSLFWINGDPAWEDWGVYFLGSYAVGVLTEGALSRRLPRFAFWAYLGLIGVALVIEWRFRLAVSAATGLVLFFGGISGVLSNWPKSRGIEAAAQSSYSLFLIHFPVCLVVNAAFSRFALHSPPLCLLGMLTAYGLSVAASVWFFRHVERAFH
jgi:peptidoglycan/LPS O-acetylase OafA/YrhL